METYDVIIVGAGPAGLKCAEVLGKAKKKVLLLEKNPEIGPKVCAGGLTRKSIKYLNIPDNIVERKFNGVTFKSKHNQTRIDFGETLLFTINRKNLGQWLLKKVDTSFVDIRMETRADTINKNFIITNKKEKNYYNYLVGADGANSIVRKFLKLNTKLLAVAYQYIVPEKLNDLEMHFNSDFFKCWYAWIFPYSHSTSIGSSYNPQQTNAQESRKKFNNWIKQNDLDVSRGKFQAHLINCDYQGYVFGNIFLVGEAAGLVDRLTGEGIYAAVRSGEDVASLILNPSHKCRGIENALKEKKFNERVLKIINISGSLRDLVFAFITYIGRNKRIARLILRAVT